MEFGKYANYMALGYAAMALLLGGMVLWLYLRYRALIREEQAIEQMEAEERAERAAAAPAVTRGDGAARVPTAEPVTKET
jgi:heme exporter protein CcmD